MQTPSAGRIVCAVILFSLCWSASTGFANDAPSPANTPDASQETQTRQLARQILERSQAARNSLEEKRFDRETQVLQRQVADDLQKLIDLLKQGTPPSNSPDQSPNSRSNSNSNSNSQSDSSPSSRSPQNPGDQSSAPEPSESQGGSGAEQDREQPQDSEERHGPSRESQARAQRKLRLESDVWGHLPPALREKLLNSYGERMLPQYEELVRKFYDALSEPTRSPKR